MEQNYEKKRRKLDCSRKLCSVTDTTCLDGFCNGERSDIWERRAVVFDNGKGQMEELSYQQLDAGANEVKNILERILAGSVTSAQKTEQQQEFFGIKCQLGRLYPVLVLGILRSGHAFYNLDSENLESSLADGVTYLGLKYVLSSADWKGTASLSKLFEEKSFNNFDEETALSYNLFKLTTSKAQLKLPKENFAYAIQTSGTTGLKKTVLVPHLCICSNIEDFLENHWKVSKTDVIFGSAPPTFDPHVVELFTALGSGATILYTTPEVKINGSLLASLINFHKVTILQTTPSLFRKLALCSVPMEHLRIIAFGGEKCPEIEELREITKDCTNQKIIFQNVYGVTEVSCWATVANIDMLSSQPITIGNAMKNTEVALDKWGQIEISSSTRYCVIIDPATCPLAIMPPTASFKYQTGDIGTLTGSGGIIFQGRSDRVVKRNGMKICLQEVEAAAFSTGLISFAEAKLYERKIYLVVTFRSEYENKSLSSESLERKLELPLFMYPDHIISLNRKSIPLNGNGKLDWNAIIKSLRTTPENRIPFLVSKQQIFSTLAPIWKSCTSHSRTDCEDDFEKTFKMAGGTSISAARFVESSFMALKLFGSEIHRKSESELLVTLLNETEGKFETIAEKIVDWIMQSADSIQTSLSRLDMDLLPETQEALPENITLAVPSHPWPDLDLNTDGSQDLVFNEVEKISGFSTSSVIRSPPEPAKQYKFPLGLCVDASAAVVPGKSWTIIGCHGGVLLCIDLDLLRANEFSPELAMVWKRKFPNRIEATVEVHSNSLFAYFGCHDSNFYKISVVTGKTSCWTKVGSPIRSKCAIYNDLVVFVDSNNSVHCLDCHALNKLWCVNSFKLLATMCPVIFRGRCLLATLDKGIVSINCSNGTVLWNGADDYSNDCVYSSPVIIESRRRAQKRKTAMLVCASNRRIEARDVKTGVLLWSHEILSSGRVLSPLLNNCCDNVILFNGVSDSTFVKVLKVETGELLRTVRIPHLNPVTPCLVYAKNHVSDIIGKRECYLCYKSSVLNDEGLAIPKLVFLQMHNMSSVHKTEESQFQSDAGLPKMFDMNSKDFETFSKPLVCSEFILFGGRDNNLHVVKMKS